MLESLAPYSRRILSTSKFSPLRPSFPPTRIQSPREFPLSTVCRSFSNTSHLWKPPSENETEANPKPQKRKQHRSPAAKNSLRRVAVEAQRSRDGKKKDSKDSQPSTKTVTAYCAAEQYDIAQVAEIVKGGGYHLNPYETGLYPQVVHIEVPNQSPSRRLEGLDPSTGDVFIFPSGTVVAWDVPDSTMSFFVNRTLLPAAQQSHLDQLEEEDLEYMEDPTHSSSAIKGDTIVLGTRTQSPAPDQSQNSSSSSLASSSNNPDEIRNTDTTLTKIAFSSGLARSTKLAVLETLLATYLTSTLSIPRVLSHGGGRLPFTRSFILQKTGQLLLLRAQLNLYSELTDSLPDLFWDSRHELGLEGYYDMVGRALDTNVRIKVLNEKMDYAQEIASVLRQQLSEKHGVRLEWIIILLITVEVGFAVRQEVKEWRERQREA
ncbi:MAG: hypothetical protein Q9228_002765 [Teloschistes exilis]